MNLSLNDRINLRPVTRENWRDLSKLRVHENQREWVADPTYYLCMCLYDKLWNPKAIYRDETVIGFLMWAWDEDEDSYWLGGIIIDKNHQKQGFGKAAINKMIKELTETKRANSFALSYAPDNPAARLYKELGFEDSGEFEDEEIVARLKV